MKKYISIALTIAAAIIALSSCVKIDHSDEYVQPKVYVAEDAVYDLALFHVYEYDPMHTAGIDIVDELDFFKSYRFKIYHEDSRVAAVEITHDLPFSTYAPLPIPEGKQAAYLNTKSVPYTIRLKSNDQVVATWINGEYVITWQLGCEEISYKLNFKKAQN